MHGTTRRTALTVVLTLTALTAAACDNPIRPEEHPEAGGVVIFSAGTNTILTQSIGAGANAVWSAPLTLTAGQALEVDIRFLDDSDPTNLALAFLPDADEGESLSVEIVNTAIAEYHDHGDHGDFDGIAAGQTTAVISIMHGSHSDFDSGTLTIVVE